MIKETDLRVARIAPLETVLDPISLSRETSNGSNVSNVSNVSHLRTSITLAEKCLEATTLVLAEVSTEEEEEAEPSSRRELHTTEAMLLPTRSATASGTCLTTEETRTSTSLGMIGSRIRTVGILVTENSMTSIPGQATIPLPGDQSDLLWVLPCLPMTSHRKEDVTESLKD